MGAELTGRDDHGNGTSARSREARRTDHTRPRRSSLGLILFAGLLALTAIGMSAYAWQLWTKEQQALTELKTARTTAADLRKGQQETDRKVIALEAERGESRARLETASTNLVALEANLAATESQLSELEVEREKVKERLAEFRAMTAQFQRMIDNGRLEVHFRRGRMIVELPAQVLFPSGSADLSEEGGEALREVAKILRGFRNKHFIVAGHTDNVPLGTGGAFANNWELSSARAVNVTEALIKSGLLPRQLVAAGYAEHDPVAKNTSPEGRKKNRRIEIVLEPLLKELPGLEDISANK